MVERAVWQTYSLFGMMTAEVESDGLKLRRDELPIAVHFFGPSQKRAVTTISAISRACFLLARWVCGRDKEVLAPLSFPKIISARLAHPV
jgi:hypothetical protein